MLFSLQVSYPTKASEASFARENTQWRWRWRDLARLALFAQIGEHARKLGVALLHN